MPLTLNTPVSRTDNLLFSTLGGEEVILNLDTGVYYGLERVGARAWKLLETEQTARAVCDRLEAEYDVDRATLEQDVLALFRSFEDEGLLQCPANPEA